MEKLRFIITKEGFRVDEDVYTEKEIKNIAENFAKTPYETLYAMSFQKCPDCFDTAGLFLHQLAEGFAEELTHISGLELSRESTELVPGEDRIEILLNSVPFVLGAEYVTRTWIKRQYRKLLEIFKKQISVYNGKVSLYFAEKRQEHRLKTTYQTFGRCLIFSTRDCLEASRNLSAFAVD